MNYFFQVKRILIATAVLAAGVWWYTRTRPAPPVVATEPAVESIEPRPPEIATNTRSPSSLTVPAEWMLSRTGVVAATTVESDPATSPTNRPTPPVTMNRILAPYARPSTMLSPALTPPPLKTSDSPGVSALQFWSATESSAELFAFSYINKPAMLSKSPENLSTTWVTYSRRSAPTNSLITAPGIPQVISNDPDAMAKATFFIREAEAKVSAGLTDQAISYYAQALTMFPRMAYANKQLGRLQLMRGEYDLAAHYLTAAIEGDNTPGETLNDLGIAHLYAGRIDQALAAFEAATTADPAMTEPRFNIGLALRKGGQLTDARKAFTLYLNTTPNDARAYRELAVIDALEDQLETALQNLDRAVSIDPTWYTPRLDAALLHAERNEYDAALAQLDHALEIAPAWVVFQTYNQPPFHNLRLMPESKPFESRLAGKARKSGVR